MALSETAPVALVYLLKASVAIKTRVVPVFQDQNKVLHVLGERTNHRCQQCQQSTRGCS